MRVARFPLGGMRTRTPLTSSYCQPSSGWARKAASVTGSTVGTASAHGATGSGGTARTVLVMIDPPHILVLCARHALSIAGIPRGIERGLRAVLLPIGCARTPLARSRSMVSAPDAAPVAPRWPRWWRRYAARRVRDTDAGEARYTALALATGAAGCAWAWTSSAAMSAGVMPGSRPACPTVSGRKRASFSRASARSPRVVA